jgi:hypothetical protein
LDCAAIRSSFKNAGCQIIHLYEYEISGNVNDILITNMKTCNRTKSWASVFSLHNLSPKDSLYMYYCNFPSQPPEGANLKRSALLSKIKEDEMNVLILEVRSTCINLVRKGK